MSFFKKMSANLPFKGVKFLLHEHLAGYQKARPHHNIHASALTKTGPDEFCPREYCLLDLLEKVPKDEFVPACSAVTWEMGRMFQDMIVNDLANAGKAVCSWRCVSCGHLHEFCKRPMACASCSCKAFRPVEPRGLSKETGASCGIDVLVDLGLPKLRIVEIKTMLKDDFKNLIAPIAEHKVRTSMYLQIVADTEAPWAQYVDTEAAHILYMCKGGLHLRHQHQGLGPQGSSVLPLQGVRGQAQRRPYRHSQDEGPGGHRLPSRGEGPAGSHLPDARLQTV